MAAGAFIIRHEESELSFCRLLADRLAPNDLLAFNEDGDDDELLMPPPAMSRCWPASVRFEVAGMSNLTTFTELFSFTLPSTCGPILGFASQPLPAKLQESTKVCFEESAWLGVEC